MVKTKAVAVKRGGDNKLRKTGDVGSQSTLVKEPVSLKGVDIDSVDIKSKTIKPDPVLSKWAKLVPPKHRESFLQLEQGLKDLGYFDENDSILKFSHYKSKVENVIYVLRKDDQRSWPLFNFNTKTGRVESLLHSFERDNLFKRIVEKRWGEVETFGIEWMNDNLALKEEREISAELSEFGTTVKNSLFVLEEGIKQIKEEITRQGYKVENKHVSTLLEIQELKLYPEELVGEIEDWVPYVCSDLPEKDLLFVLSTENNKDYETTGKIAIPLQLAKSMVGIHSSFKKAILDNI